MFYAQHDASRRSVHSWLEQTGEIIDTRVSGANLAEDSQTNNPKNYHGSLLFFVFIDTYLASSPQTPDHNVSQSSLLTGSAGNGVR